MIDSGGEPGVWFNIDEDISSGENSTSGPPRSCCCLQMKAALYAVSFASDPAIAVKTWLRPFGATRKMPVSRIEAQLCGGKLPRAGRLISAEAMSGEVAARRSEGLL